ncbi:CoA transferase subunit A [bacterium]|nr:CoA transferase subunit A [bacterium]
MSFKVVIGVENLSKLITAKEAAALIKNGSTVMVGGFLSCGTPNKIIDEMVAQKIDDLTMICNDTSFADVDRGKLIKNGLVKKVITTHIGTNPITGSKMQSGELEVEFYPMGTLVEKIHAKGSGLGGVLTPTGVGTILEEDKKVIEIKGKKYIFEEPLGADYAVIYGSTVDKYGNVAFKGTTRNFNTSMATAAETVIIEAEEVVEELDPNNVVIPGIFIDYIVDGRK